MTAVIQYALYLAILVGLALPLGAYIKKVMNGEKTLLSRVLTPRENAIYKVLRVDREEQMSWKKYAASVLAFSRWSNDVASLRVFMATLRKKLEANPGSPQYIQTHIGVGCRMMKVE